MWASGGAAVCLIGSLALAGPAAAAPSGTAGAYRLLTTGTGSSYAPTFTGNGVLGVRVPAAGQGYAAGSVPALSELAGFYAQPSGAIQQRATIPTWSTLTLSVGGQPFSPATGTTSGWRQSLDLHTGVVSTSADWTAPDGHLTAISYQLLTDRARPDVGLVRLTLVPRWSGTAVVTDMIDGTPATLTAQGGKGWETGSQHGDWISVQAEGTGISVAIASRLGLSADVRATSAELDATVARSIGQQLSFSVRAGRTYTITKYVGVVSSQDSADPMAAAQARATSARRTGFSPLLRANHAALAALWQGRIDVLGSRTLASAVNASEFYLWSSIRPGIAWSISPAGLSATGYNGHIFWDADTWMFPALLAQHPELAAGINAYRFQRLGAAEQHATATGYQGARYPWESALDGTEQIPPPASQNSEGIYEQHVTADVALAQWQYYLATRDKGWLARRGWPVLSQAAIFWASRVTPGSGASYDIDGVTGPDEDNPDVNDEVYTDAAAATTLEDAISAANVLHLNAPAKWATIASHLVVPVDNRLGVHPEFSGYLGQIVKQADVTLLGYPLGYPMPANVAQNDLDYYVPRTDPAGPSMSDAISSIDSSALDSPGCASYVYTLRSYQPFIRDEFDQFSENRTGGAFTFMTGIGGFLQEFLYGYSGMRLTAASVQLDPSLTSQLAGIVLHDLAWHRRRFTVAIGLRTTRVTLQSGAPLPIETPAGTRRVTRARPARITTRRPDLEPTDDVVRCGQASSSSSVAGAPPLAAVDGSPATGWQPASLPATVTLALAGGAGATISSAILDWGQQWPPAILPGEQLPAPVTTLRASSYALEVSDDGHTWQTVATVTDRPTGTADELSFAPTHARYVRVQITAALGGQLPVLDELTVPASR